MKKPFFKIFVVICAVLTLNACTGTTADNGEVYVPTTTEQSTERPAVNYETEQVQVYKPTETTTTYTPETSDYAPAVSDYETLPTPSVHNPPTAPIEQTEIITTEKTYEKTGEMAFSDSADNRYISAISQKYGVEAKHLVALYTVPENDSNIVLQFDGSTDANGKLIRNKDTLIAIYSVDKSLNSKRASENNSLNEYSYGEMKVMFLSVTSYIMPEFEEELNG